MPSKRVKTRPQKNPAADRESTSDDRRGVDAFTDDHLSSVAHDLRGSLNSIMGWAELIRRETLPAEGAVKAGETIIRQAKRQLELINELVDTWRLLSGNLQLKLAPVDAKELVNQAIPAAREGNEKKVTFDVKVEALPRPLFADGARIRQALIGLFTSAIHFAPEGGTIEVRLRPGDQGHAELTVHDRGVEMDPAALPYLFSRQRQESQSKPHARSKFGRGLALIRDVIDLHGGTIKAETGDARGVTFRVTLPLASVPSAVIGGKARRIERSTQEAQSRLAGTVVLIVDDDPDAREVVGVILRRYGAKVIVATSVSTALVALRREHVDVLIADLGMPVEDGFDLIRQVRESDTPAVAVIPAAALTAYTTEEDRERVLTAGFQFHLAKPVDPAVLVATVERLHSERQLVH